MAIPKVLRGKVFRGCDAVRAGIVSRDQLRGRGLQRLFQGIYADATFEVTLRIRCEAALAYLLPVGSVIAGRTAAMLQGVSFGSPVDPIEALIPAAAQPCRHPGIVVHRGALAPGDRVDRRRVSLTGPVRTCWDLSRWLDPVEAVAWVDRLVAAGRVSPAELAQYRSAAGRQGQRGIRRFDRVRALVDGRSESGPESRLRVRLAVAGLAPPEVQFVVRDQLGQFVARVDLAWPDRMVAIEYDGLWHVGSREQMNRDRRRLTALASSGWTVLHVTAPRLRDDFDGFAAELRRALSITGR